MIYRVRVEKNLREREREGGVMAQLFSTNHNDQAKLLLFEAWKLFKPLSHLLSGLLGEISLFRSQTYNFWI